MARMYDQNCWQNNFKRSNIWPFGRSLQAFTADMLAAGETITVSALGTEKQSQSLHFSSLDDLRRSKSTLVPSIKSLNCGV